ncbi:MAG TPA: hypothetical protein VF467_09335, partial [Afipia sp.]
MLLILLRRRVSLFHIPGFVMAGLVPAIYVFPDIVKTWMPGIKPGMATESSRQPSLPLFPKT